MECPQIDLYEFLTESELQQYYNAIKNELKITNAAQFKYAADEDLRFIGLSRPEIRRLRKFYEKHFPHSYISKIKRLLQAPATIVKREDGAGGQASNESSSAAATPTATRNGSSSPGSKVPNNKHIIPADSISVNKQLGIGEFGIVQQGVWTNGSERIQVAIKCLCRERMQSNPMEFLKEAAIMHSIEHENIVRLYGVVLATDSLMLVTELAHLRSLLECLKDSGLRVSFLTIPTLCEFALQICNGMRYLEQKRLIHRDLAARNILVFSKDKVKISDFGLSRALGVGKDYYKTNFNVNLKLPIAWCAPECINYLRFTNASDVWAYGVCLWEMFSYGFQPWAALTGLQILEAIDAPNYQRLEQPDCCPREYYTLMMKCWQDDAAKRPKFSEIYEQLPDMKPEQLKAVVNCVESKKDHLLYRQGDIITVLDRNTGTPFWKGVLSTGKTGFFNPSNTVAFLEGLPCSSNRDSFSRVGDHRISKRKLRTEMISKPQNDFKHTGHVGIDGATFGDIAFLGSSQNYNHVPKQIVTPYKPSEDIEQTPLLLPPTPTSPDSLQTASGYFPEGAGTSMNPTFIPSTEHTPKLIPSNGHSSFDFAGSTNPFASHTLDEDQLAFALHNNNYGADGKSIHSEPNWRASSRNTTDDPHEYHEISDDEIAGDKLDFGPSLLDEINSMFGSISGASGSQPKSPDFDHVNTKNEFAEMSAKFGHKSGDSNGNKHGHGLLPTLSKKKTTTGTVKPISVKDEKILNHAIEIANEISARSMIDLVSDHTPATHSPKRKFSFRFPHLSSGGGDKSSSGQGSAAGGSALTPTHGNASPFSKKKNFTEELQSIPDIQRFRSLGEFKNTSELRIPIFDKESSDFLFEKSREILSRPLNRELNSEEARGVEAEPKSINDNIMDIENTLKALNLDFMHTYTELDKSDSNDTILNDQMPQLLGSLDDGIGSANGSLKSAVYSYSNGVQTMFDFNAATSHLDKHLQYMHNQAQLHSQQPEQKLVEDKRSSTPDTGFASRDTNISLSRRSSQKSSYSPQESYFPMKTETLYSAPPVVMSSGYERFGNGHTKQLLASASPIKSSCLNASSSSVYAAAAAKSHRQRSTSFNESFQSISPVLSEPKHRQFRQESLHQQHSPLLHQLQQQMPMPRRSASYKPRSIRARTLRRLSYNPMTLDSSSSSSGDEEHSKPSLARSECDIRDRIAGSSSSSLCRRRRAGLNRQVQSACQDERETIVSPRQLYGSNSSIKSAPHYNLSGNRRSFHRPGTGYEQFHYDERIYDFGGRGPGNNYTSQMGQHALLAATQSQKLSSGSGSSSATSSAVATYRTASAATAVRPMSGVTLHEFDISRLTGKSPTSTNFVGSSPDELKQQRQQTQAQAQLPVKPQRPTEFHWPEKIHASTVQQHEMHWRQLKQQQQQQQQQQLSQPSQLPLVTAARDSSDSSSSSSTESGDEFQSLIGEEGREAYNSLIERKGMLDIGPSPAATLLRHMDTDEFELMNAKTLPRRLGSQLSHSGTSAASAAPAAGAGKAPGSPDCVRPLQRLHPPRPMTLPTRGAAQRVRRAEQASDENRNSLGPSDACESPSYMTHGSYKFPEPQETNPLPLPSREGKKQVKTNAKRHVRKYPLIIPANGVQRTLNKLADFGDDGGKAGDALPQQQPQQHQQKEQCQTQQQQQQQPQTRSIEVVAAVRSNSIRRRLDAREYENMPAIAGDTAAHTYQNLDKLAPADAAGLTDSASLQFESILEADMSKEGVLQSPDVTDGFYNFSIQKEHYNKSKDVGFEPAQVTGLYVNDDELRNLDKPLAASSSSTTLDSPAVPQEMAPTAASAVAAAAAAATVATATAAAAEACAESNSSRRLANADNELAGNALFKKVRASVNQAMNRNTINGKDPHSPFPSTNASTSKPQTEAEYFAATAARLADSNSVSCEDLLEFSDKKPRGCERGVDSDEVRIMVKVLGKDSTPTRCLAALEFINWDVHKSIKLIKLQNILAGANLSLSAAYEALQQQEWDLHTTAVKLKGMKL